MNPLNYVVNLSVLTTLVFKDFVGLTIQFLFHLSKCRTSKFDLKAHLHDGVEFLQAINYQLCS